MPRVFISHSSLDRDFVERQIIAPLRSHGIETWYSKDSIETAAEWEKKIREGLRSCDWFLVVMTPRSVASKWVQREVFWAMERREGRIIPVLLETCDPEDLHLGLLPIQYIDFRQEVEAARRKLLSIWERDRAEQIHSLDRAAQTAIAQEDWPAAVGKLQELVKLDPARAEAQEQLESARRQQELAELYATGLNHFEAGRWPEALNVLRSVRARERNYRDVAELIADADARLTEIKEEKQREREKQAGEAKEAEGPKPKAAEEAERKQAEEVAKRKQEEEEAARKTVPPKPVSTSSGLSISGILFLLFIVYRIYSSCSSPAPKPTLNLNANYTNLNTNFSLPSNRNLSNSFLNLNSNNRSANTNFNK